MTLNNHEATYGERKKETKNVQAFPVSWVVWDDPENNGKSTTPVKTIKKTVVFPEK